MTASDFLSSPEAVQIIERAGRFAAMPVSVHQVVKGQSQKLVSFGQCTACRYVANIRGGRDACNGSRAQAETASLAHDQPFPFICHMGFACISAPLLPASEGAVITFGPFCPSEEVRSLAQDFLDGLHHLDHHDRFGNQHTQPPVSLTDIRTVPAATVPEIVRWVAEELARRYQDAQQDTAGPVSQDEAPGQPLTQNHCRPSRQFDPYNAAAIAASLAADSQEQARNLVYAALAETESPARRKHPARRARAVAVLGAVLEAAERAGLETSACWRQLPEVIARLTEDEKDAGATIMTVFGILKRKTARNVSARQTYTELNDIVLSRITEPVTLNDVAAALGQTPTAITHRLQRNFGMSYTEYVGRLRIDKAKELLRRTKLNVTEVGRRIGIEDTSNFGKMFKKFEGMTPVEYRTRFAGAPGKKSKR